MKNEPAGHADAPAPGGTADDNLDDFTFESASVGSNSPEGSHQSESIAAAEMAAVNEGRQDGPDVAAGEGDPEPGVAGAAVPAAKPAAAAVAAKGAKAPQAPQAGGKKKDRVETLQQQIGTKTFELRSTEREIAKRKAELDAIDREIAARKAGAETPAAGKDGKPAVAATAAPAELPEHPKYRDFATDDEYEAAVAKWKVDVQAVMAARETALKTDIEKSIDTRLSSRDQVAQAKTVRDVVARTLQAVAAEYDDWGDHADALETIRSSWFDPEKHGDNQAPFLHDLAFTRLQEGDAEGGHLLRFYGEDAERAQALADLLPTRGLRDALVVAPHIRKVLAYFATDEGAKEFENLSRMPAARVSLAVGALSARLGAASGGTARPAHSITKATHPGGHTRGDAKGRGQVAAKPAAASGDEFEAFMAQEDAKEQAARERLLSAR